jgi:Leu/Phe-tRNA-protein transferase
MLIHFTGSGHLFISPDDDCKTIVDAMLAMNYSEDFCIADDFDPEFAARLMEAGFLVTSGNIAKKDGDPVYILFPQLHLKRSALFFDNLHIKKSVRRFLNRFELRADVEFDYIIDRCIKRHGADWLTPPLVNCIREIRNSRLPSSVKCLAPHSRAYPTSFALYRDETLVAGEFGVVCGRIYTSYSGFCVENNTGTVQIIHTTRYLQEKGFLYFDLGMPMEYKTAIGAVNIDTYEFVQLFREANIQS